MITPHEDDKGDAEPPKDLAEPLTDLDLRTMRQHLIDALNAIHMPEDTGQYADGLRAIMERIPENWGRWIRCGKGWYPIICDLNEQIAALHPDYEVYQVKEKFGRLRYYCSNSGAPEVQSLIAAAEAASAITDEETGEPGVLMVSPSGWLQTRNPADAPEGWTVVEDEE